MAPLAAGASVYVASRPAPSIALFFLQGDILPLLAAGLCLALVAQPSMRLGAARASWIAALVERRGWAICAATALIVGLGAYVGWHTLYQRYPLAMDEFWAQFDADIFGRGRLLAELPARWRPFAPALQPAWPLLTPDDQYWSSRYLPVNAAFRALAGALGSSALAGPFWAALSIVTVYGLARRLWPQRRDAALVSALLLATSPQLFITAMSPYAMSAHLALNLVWLWLFLGRRAWSQALAPIAAFAATGLHQLIFHPLFAAPFVLGLWLERRWRAAIFHTGAYVLVCLFWSFYWTMAMGGLGIAPVVAGRLGTGWTLQIAAQLIASHGPGDLGLMSLNLLRFIAWQNPLAVALGALGAVHAARTRDRVFLPLAAGLILTVAAMAAIMPFQGHGWGYRYLHGFLGSLCLLAGLAWVRLTPARSEALGETAARPWAAIGVSCAFCLIFALPLRARQTFDLIRPSARAQAAIEGAGAEVVVVDPAGLDYGESFVRNDPFLEIGPKVMNIDDLTVKGARILCAGYKVALFDMTDAKAFGVRRVPPPPPSALKAAVLRVLSCAAHVGRRLGG